MATPQQVSWALGSPAVIGIADDEAPTAFYRRRRSARLEATSPSLPPSLPPSRPRAKAPRAPNPRPPASPATLLLPTGSAPEATSDGTILTPLTGGNNRAQRAARPRSRSFAEFWESLSQAATEHPALRGYGLLTSAVALGLLGVLAVTYAYITTNDPIAHRAASAGHDSIDVGPADRKRGFIHRACDLSRRLERIQKANTNHHAGP